jgi:hypothetical protein
MKREKIRLAFSVITLVVTIFVGISSSNNKLALADDGIAAEGGFCNCSDPPRGDGKKLDGFCLVQDCIWVARQ